MTTTIVNDTIDALCNRAVFSMKLASHFAPVPEEGRWFEIEVSAMGPGGRRETFGPVHCGQNLSARRRASSPTEAGKAAILHAMSYTGGFGYDDFRVVVDGIGLVGLRGKHGQRVGK